MVFPADQHRWAIRSRGRKATLVRKATTPGNPARPWEGLAAGEADLSDEVVIRFKPVKQRDVDGDRVLETDQIAQIVAAEVTGRAPLIGDQVLISGTTLNVMATTTKQERGVALRYDLRLRA